MTSPLIGLTGILVLFVLLVLRLQHKKNENSG